MSKTFTAVATLIGTVVGAGFLAIPYVAMHAGLSITLVHIVVAALIMMLAMLYIGEVVLRTRAVHQLTGYAEKYTGKLGRKVMFVSYIVGVYSALVAYIIAQGEALSYLFFSTTQFHFELGLVFWIVLSLLCYRGIRALKEGESIGVVLVMILIIALTVLAIPHINYNNLTYTNLQNAFLPFGVVFFAFIGYSIIPEIAQILGKDRKYLKRSIVTAYVLVAIMYIVFTTVVLGYKGADTPEIATIGLGKPFALLGIVTLFTAYLALSTTMMDTFRFDFKKSRRESWSYTVLIPIAIYVVLELVNSASFITLLTIGGIISGGLTLMLTFMMIYNAKKYGDRTPEYSMPYSPILGWILTILFIAVVVAELVFSL